MKALVFVLFVVLALGAPATGAHADPGYPLTVTDASGYRLTLASRPKAIVSLTLATDEILVDLVPGRLKAIDSFAADPGISNIAPFAQAFPLKISGEKERLIALQPDLVFLADWKEKEFIQALRDAKVPVFVFKTPNNLEQMLEGLVQIAALVGEPSRGQALVSSLQKRLAAVTVRLSLLAGPRLRVLSYSFGGTTYGRGTSFDALAEAAGLVNAATQAGLSGWPQVSKEQVLDLDPDLVVLPSWSYGTKDDPGKFRTDFLHDLVFSSLKAVKNQRVIVLPDKHLQASSQYMVDGVEDLARAAYPELFR